MNAYRRDTVTHVMSGGTDKYGSALPSTEVSVSARIVLKSRLITTMSGEQVVSSGYIDIAEKPSHADNFVIDGTSYVIADIRERKAFTKVLGYEVWLR